MTDIRYPYQGGVTSTDGQGLVIDPITGQLTLVLDGTSLSKSSSGLKWNDASTQFIDVSSSSTAFRVTQRGTGAALLIEDSANPDASPFVIDASGRVAIGATSTTSKLLITENSSSPAVQITQAGTGLCLLVEDAASPDSSPFAIDADGRVGIGTLSPQELLHVAGTGIVRAQVENTTNAGYAEIRLLTQGGDFKFGTSGSAFGADCYLFNVSATSFLFGTTNTERMRITASGNVGINTNNPTSKLQINDNSSNPAVFINQLGAGPALLVEDSTNPDSTPFVIDSNGNVGIGTTSPGAKLDVNGSIVIPGFESGGTSALSFRRAFPAANNVGIRTKAISTANYDGMEIVGHNGIDLSVNSGTVVVQRILANGNVGIGTTSPGSTLQVNGGAAVGYNTSTAAPTNGLLVNGNVGLGTTAPGSRISINGGSSIGASYCTVAAPSNGLIVQGYVGCGTSNPTSALHLGQTAGVAEAATCLLDEKDTTPASPTSGTQVKMYMKADKIIFQYNDGGTVRYKYLDLTGTTDTWTATTTAP